ncbi:MAG: S-adenosylmethionine decarboxylase [Nanobdellota archaeon]
MPQRFQLIVDIWNCDGSVLQNHLAVTELLGYLVQLMQTKPTLEPVTKNRGKGIFGFVLTPTSHLTLTTFPTTNEVALDTVSWVPFDMGAIRNHMMKYFNVGLNNLRVQKISSYRDSDVECEEPGCTKPATREWGGRMVCQDHFTRYRDQEMEFMDSTPSFSYS